MNQKAALSNYLLLENVYLALNFNKITDSSVFSISEKQQLLELLSMHLKHIKVYCIIQKCKVTLAIDDDDDNTLFL